MTGSVLAAAMAAALMAGCSNRTQQAPATTAALSAETSAAGKETEAAAKGEEVTLRMSWWGGDSRHERLLALIDEFEKENQPNNGPEISLEFIDDQLQSYSKLLNSGIVEAALSE